MWRRGRVLGRASSGPRPPAQQTPLQRPARLTTCTVPPGASGPAARFALTRRPRSMSRPSVFGSPLFLGFDHLEQMLDRVAKNADGYPPYNIEQVAEGRLRITLAVAGFAMDDLQITQEDNQLAIRGRQKDESEGRVRSEERRVGKECRSRWSP